MLKYSHQTSASWLALLLIIFYSSPAFAQERVSRKPIELIPASYLLSATGWMLSPSGQWESAINKIPYRLGDAYSSIKNSGTYSLGTDNFKKFNFYTAKSATNEFVIFTKTYTEGRYRYPNIKKGWFDGTFTRAYAIEINEIKKLSDIKNGKVNRITLSAFDYMQVRMKSPPAALRDIIQNLAFSVKNNKKVLLHFEIAPYKEKQIIQFNIFDSQINSIRGDTYIDNKNIFGSDELFEHFYYETSHSSFSELINGILKELKLNV
jgi:hypothetical protein